VCGLTTGGEETDLFSWAKKVLLRCVRWARGGEIFGWGDQRLAVIDFVKIKRNSQRGKSVRFSEDSRCDFVFAIFLAVVPTSLCGRKLTDKNPFYDSFGHWLGISFMLKKNFNPRDSAAAVS